MTEATGTGARWEAVAQHLRAQIESGELASGSQITPEAQLGEELGVSRHTIRRALQALADEGLVTEGKGKLGRRVRTPAELLTWNLTEFENTGRTDTREADAWNHGILEQGKRARQDVTVMREAATGEIAQWLDLPESAPVTVRRRVRYADGRAYQISTSYFPDEIARGTVLETPGDQSAPGGLLESIGHPQHFVQDRIRGRLSSYTEQETLDLVPGTPVLEHVRVGYGAEHHPIRVMVTIAPCDRWQLQYDISLAASGDDQ